MRGVHGPGGGGRTPEVAKSHTHYMPTYNRYTRFFIYHVGFRNIRGVHGLGGGRNQSEEESHN